MSEYLEAYSDIGKHFLQADDRDDLLCERYTALLDALWWRLTEAERKELTRGEDS